MRLWVLAGLVSLIGAGVVLGSSIVGSKHDLTADWNKGSALMRFTLNNYGEVCVYCHTPHSASTEVDAPLWNRRTPAGAYSVYSSTTMDTVPGQPTGVSLACLSCHDGTVAVDAILNAPGSGANTAGPWYGQSAAPFHFAMASSVNNCGECHNSSGPAHDASNSYLSTDLSNDHPIAMAYPTAAQDPNFRQPSGAPGQSRSFPNGVKTFAGDKVECPSCHNVHDPLYTPFLRTDNAGSALCVTCHIK